jgi:hypothetical protein
MQTFTYDNKIFVVGGQNGNSDFLSDAYYSVDGVTWTQVSSFINLGVRNGASAMVYSGSMWIVGGTGPEADPMNDAWYSCGSIAVPTATNTATATATVTQTTTATVTFTATQSATPSITQTPSQTATQTCTLTAVNTPVCAGCGSPLYTFNDQTLRDTNPADLPPLDAGGAAMYTSGVASDASYALGPMEQTAPVEMCPSLFMQDSMDLEWNEYIEPEMCSGNQLMWLLYGAGSAYYTTVYLTGSGDSAQVNVMYPISISEKLTLSAGSGGMTQDGWYHIKFSWQNAEVNGAMPTPGTSNVTLAVSYLGAYTGVPAAIGTPSVGNNAIDLQGVYDVELGGPGHTEYIHAYTGT